MPARIAVIYYSATGSVHALAEAVADGAAATGAEVRLRRVEETVSPEVVAGNPAWQATADRTAAVPIADHDDLIWANGLAFGTPSRFGATASQLKALIDSCGGLWAQGQLANKAATSFASAMNTHGGNEATILSLWTVVAHWGCVIVPPGYTDPALYAAGGNPYGTSWTSGQDGHHPDAAALAAARIQGSRVANVADALDGRA